MAYLTPSQALVGGLQAALAPSSLLVYPVYAVFLLSSLHEHVSQTRSHLRRDYGVTVLFFLVGFLCLFVAGQMSGGHSGGFFLGRLLGGVFLAVWGSKLIFGFQLKLFSAEKNGAQVDDWPVSGVVALAVGAVMAIAWVPLGGTVMGDILLMGHQNEGQGALAPMMAYGFGITLVLLALAIPGMGVAKVLACKPRALQACERVGGWFLAFCGLFMVFGGFEWLAALLGRLAPALTQLG